MGQLPVLLLPSREVAWHFVTVAALPLGLSTTGGIVVLGGLLLIELRRLVEGQAAPSGRPYDDIIGSAPICPAVSSMFPRHVASTWVSISRTGKN